VTAVTTRADGVTVRFAKRLRHPPGGTRLSVRCGLRWSPRGRVAWHLGHEAAQILNDLIDGGRNVGVNTETVISTRFVDGRVEPATRPAAATGTS